MIRGRNRGENPLMILFMCGCVKQVGWFGLPGMY